MNESTQVVSPATRAFGWDARSLESAKSVQGQLDRSEAWAAYLSTFGPTARTVAWVDVNGAAALVQFQSCGPQLPILRPTDGH